MPDGGYFYEDFSVDEMKKIVASSYENWDEEYYNKLFSKFNLSKTKKIKELSKGNKMKFSLALALSHKAKLLIMDEPTSGLDPLVRFQILEILKDYVSNQGGSVLLSTHITSDLEKIADDIILIDNGEIIFCQSMEQLKDEFCNSSEKALNIEKIMLSSIKKEEF